MWILEIYNNFLRKNHNSDVIYSPLLLVYNLFTEWEVEFNHIQKINLIAFAASDFLHRKAML